MGFYAPWMLLGGLAIAVPLVLHFFYRARYKKVPWGAMSFLKQAIEQTSRRLRFQEWILLALRCLLLLLLAFALARPTFSGSSAGGRGDAVDAVFIFDTSYSMGARDGDKSRFERAKDAALAVIDNLPPNSTVQVIGGADRATHLGPQSPGNLDQARQTVQGIELTSLSTDYLPGLNEAFVALDRGAGLNKEVYLFSDLGKSGFERQAASMKAKAIELKSRATLLMVRCGRETPANVTVAEITHPGGIPHKGARMPFTVLLRNSGTKPVANLSVTLEIDGRVTEKETAAVATIAPGQTLPVTLTALLDEPGPRVVTARLTSDDLPGDNTLSRVIGVRDRVNVIIVDGAPDRGDAKESASHYIRNAFLPVTSGVIDDYFVRVSVVPVEEAGPGLLAGCDLLVLANVPASDADKPGVPGLSREFVERMTEYVKAGGGLLIGSGDHIVPQRYNAVLGLAGANILPYDVDETASTTPERPFKIAGDSVEPGSYLKRLGEEPFRTVTADADVFKLSGMKVTDIPGSRVLLKTADQRPFVLTKAVGDGEVIFITTSLDAKWGNWAAKGSSFLPFVQMTLAHLTGKAIRGANRVAGEPLVWSPPQAAKGFDLVRSDGRRIRLGKATGGGGNRLSVTAPDVPLAGLYKIVSEDDSITSPPFAVAPDLRESDNLEAFTDQEIEEKLGMKPVFLNAGTGAETQIAGERSRREWTVWVLLVLFAVAVGEALWAWLCGKAW
ncbi:hypothetical protein BH11PLA2_BH11PLA2_29380 [soil metagenome]